MIRTLRTLAVGAAVSALVVAGTASPAAAKTRTFTDKSRDAAASIDITKVTVTNKKGAVVVRATVPGLKKSQVGGVVVAIKTKAKGRPEFIASKMRIENVGWLPLSLMSESADELDVACKGDRISYGKRSVTVRIPQRCLGANKKAVRVGVALMNRDLDVLDDLEPEEGPEAGLDAYPSITSEKLSRWVGYR